MNDQPIGLLDSGVGGLTVVKKVIAKMPNESTVFIGDNANIPYGDKTKAEIINLTRQSVKFLLKQKAKLIIFACNTATAAAMPAIQAEINEQIIGVIQSGSQAAVQVTNNKKVAVVSTKVTAESHAYAREINSRDPQIKVTELAAPKLVPLIEKDAPSSEILQAVRETLVPLEDQDFDTLILGCTHYPIIRSDFEQCLGANIQLVDPADQAAQNACDILKRNGLLNSGVKKPTHEYYTTGSAARVEQLGAKIMQNQAFSAEHI